MDEDKIETIKNKYGMPHHYYGGLVRKLFIFAAFVMIATLPFFNNNLSLPPFFSIISIIILGLAAGLLEPRNKLAFVCNLIISILGVLIFEYYAIATYQVRSFTDAQFLVNQLLAIIFLFALYNSTKTLRSLSA